MEKATGAIRELSQEDPLRKGEVEITEEEKIELEKHLSSERLARLHELRARAGKSKGAKKRARKEAAKSRKKNR